MDIKSFEQAAKAALIGIIVLVVVGVIIGVGVGLLF